MRIKSCLLYLTVTLSTLSLYGMEQYGSIENVISNWDSQQAQAVLGYDPEPLFVHEENNKDMQPGMLTIVHHGLGGSRDCIAHIKNFGRASYLPGTVLAYNLADAVKPGEQYDRTQMNLAQMKEVKPALYILTKLHNAGMKEWSQTGISRGGGVASNVMGVLADYEKHKIELEKLGITAEIADSLLISLKNTILLWPLSDVRTAIKKQVHNVSQVSYEYVTQKASNSILGKTAKIITSPLTYTWDVLSSFSAISSPSSIEDITDYMTSSSVASTAVAIDYGLSMVTDYSPYGLQIKDSMNKLQQISYKYPYWNFLLKTEEDDEAVGNDATFFDSLPVKRGAKYWLHGTTEDRPAYERAHLWMSQEHAAAIHAFNARHGGANYNNQKWLQEGFDTLENTQKN